MSKKLTVALPALVLGLAAGCVEQPTGSTYVFGLSADEVLAAKRVAATAMTDQAWLDAHRGEFDCGRYGDLCQAVGRDRAYQIIESGYLLALDGASRDQVVAAQDQALTEALRAADAEPGRDAFYASNTNFFFGGSSNKRLKVVAHAEQMWPSLELRASATCVFQKNTFGWLPSAADHLSGSMSGVFTSTTTTTRTDSGSGTNLSTLELGPRQLAADHLTTSVSCAADEGTWAASGSATVSI